MQRFIYTGPSWANRSYDPPGSWEDANPTSLSKEWNIPCVDVSLPASRVIDRLVAVRQCLNNDALPVVWIYHEPIRCLKEATGMSLLDFVKRPDWRTIWDQCNQYCLEKINSLGVPVLLIGAHSDVVGCDYPNLTVGHDSWQKWLAERSGLAIDNDEICVKMHDGGDYKLSHCWGAELVHKFIYENPKIDPSKELVDAVLDIFFFWKHLEKSDLFFDVHPNRRATQQFAEYLLPTIKTFLQDTTGSINVQ